MSKELPAKREVGLTELGKSEEVSAMWLYNA